MDMQTSPHLHSLTPAQITWVTVVNAIQCLANGNIDLIQLYIFEPEIKAFKTSH